MNNSVKSNRNNENNINVTITRMKVKCRDEKKNNVIKL